MAKTITINRFDRGKAHDYTNGLPGESAISKLFDIHTFPQRLVPLSGVSASGEPTNTKLGKIILAENGGFYGVGTDPDNPTLGELYKASVGSVWDDFTTQQKSGFAIDNTHYNFLVHYPENRGSVRTLYWASRNRICVSDPDDGGSTTNTDTLSHSFIGQGLVHPKDKILYFPYKTTTQHFIGTIGLDTGSGEFNTKNYTAFELPSRYRAYCLSWYGNFLAVPLTVDAQAGTNRSIVALWDRDVSLTTVNENIPWGDGKLKVLNNLKGALVGVSEFAGGQDAQQNLDKIEIKVWAGGAEPITVKELVAQRLDGTKPTVQLNERVNYINNDRLYFSADITIASSLSYKGLWSVGKNRFGEWTVALERISPDETSVLTSAHNADYVTLVYDVVGQIATTPSTNVLSAIWNDNSIYETTVNPDMPAEDIHQKKALQAVYIKTMPLLTDAVAKVEYRVDSDQEGAWTEIFSYTDNGGVYFDAVTDVNGTKFTKGYNYEFRITSQEGAQITEFGYKYDVEKANI